ncbi:hypothetical protein R1sor_015078 [Riccia sorocarpa]|uniref:Ribosomal protein L2 n=1 Tax=Riccia sorocarpa TaxID=122646 RepID=A0ABD3HE63_9MARC
MLLLQRLARCCESGSRPTYRASLWRGFSSGALNAENGSMMKNSSSALQEAQVCGRGDKRTKKGKRFNHSHGNYRHQKGWETRRLREKWEIPAGPAPGSLLPLPFPPLLSRYGLALPSSENFVYWRKVLEILLRPC